jgi:hypothetical protein
MRKLLIPAFLTLIASSAFAKEGRPEWKYRHPERPRAQGYDACPEPRSYEQERWHHRHYGPRRPWGPERFGHQESTWAPAPVHSHPLPLPPPPVGIHLWFGF